MRYTIHDFHIIASEYDDNLIFSEFFRTAIMLAINNMIDEYRYLQDYDFCPRGYYIMIDFSKGTLTLANRIKNPTVIMTDSLTYWISLLKRSRMTHNTN